MAVHVDNVTTEVVAEPEPVSLGEEEPSSWNELEQVRWAYSSMMRDLARTAAENFDD